VSPPGAPGPPEGREPLAEFSLDPGPVPLSAAPMAPPTDPTEAAAALSSRALAGAADLAATVLGVSLPIVAAALWRGRWPAPAGLLFAGAFGAVLSLASTVAALFLFGKTPGMALCGLCVRPGEDGRRPSAGQAASRWLGTVFCAGTLGLPLLFTRRDASAPTPADRWSGCPLADEP
jgi:RDD family protein